MVPEPRSADKRVRAVWSRGSYGDIAPLFAPMAAHLVESAGVGPDDEVLDVCCGTGNVAITAARRGATVAGLDIVPAMVTQARTNAAIAGCPDVAWHEGTATALPFSDDAFDATLSSVGHVFAEPPEAAGRELCRVTRSGGRIAFTSWTPESVVPAMGAVVSEYLPAEPDPPDPPVRWGDPDMVRDRMGERVTDVTFETGVVTTPVLSPAHYWESATTESGLFIVALEAIDDADLPALRGETIAAIERFFDDERNAVSMEYRLATMTAA